MTSYTRWNDVRAAHVERASGDDAVAAGKDELLAKVMGYRLAEVRHRRGLTQHDVAECMGVAKRVRG